MKVSLFYLPSVGNKSDIEKGRVGLQGHLYDQMLHDITGCRFAAAPVPGRVMRAVGSAADGLTTVAPFRTPITHEAMVVLTQLPPTDDRPAVDELGVHFRPPRDTLADTIASLCEAGRLPRRMCTRL